MSSNCQVANCQVHNCQVHNGRSYKIQTDKNGFRYIKVSDNGERKIIPVKRLELDEVASYVFGGFQKKYDQRLDNLARERMGANPKRK